MDKIYISYTFVLSPIEPAREILIAELGMANFESFVETDNGFIAYIQEDVWHEAILDDIYLLKSEDFDIEYTKENIAQTNWNSEWEKNFDPIFVNNKVSIRAPFHKKPEAEYDIIIEPKMSFGTGHHETTHLMVQHLLELDLVNKEVLDMGCGTSILAILSEMRGAKAIDAIDIDNWCYVNSLENTARNNCKNITVYEGDASLLINKKYDLIIANINRNILLNDIETYTNCLDNGGVLLLSGFYEEDIPLIDAAASKNGLKLQEYKNRNNWVAVKYLK
jgi:ribosomal protein L11 methyltransferase